MCNGGKLVFNKCTWNKTKARLVFLEGESDGWIDLEMFSEADCETLKQSLSVECVRNTVYVKSIGQFATYNTITFHSVSHCTSVELEFKVVGVSSCFPTHEAPPLLYPQGPETAPRKKKVRRSKTKAKKDEGSVELDFLYPEDYEKFHTSLL